MDTAFIDFITEQMDWNHPRIIYDEENDVYQYLCMPGDGVTKYLKEACKKYGVTTKITRGMNRSRRDYDHDYYIQILRYV